MQKKMTSCKRKKDCIYAMQDECGTDRKHCGYILITDEPRGCPVDRCDKFRKRNVKSKNRPRREPKREKRQNTRKVKPFNPWVYRYFDMTKTGESEDDTRRKKKMA